jgi:hypothetical protein
MLAMCRTYCGKRQAVMAKQIKQKSVYFLKRDCSEMTVKPFVKYLII